LGSGDGYLLGLDIGTTTTRCILFDLAGFPVTESCREPPVHYPRPNWVEVDPCDWWESVVAVIREVLERSGVRGEMILGIGLSGLMHALVPVDGNGEPLARAMLWMDQRCQPQVEWMAREHSQLIEQIVGPGWAINTTPSAPKLRWIVENEPDVLRRTEKLLLVKDFVRLRLSGTVATDPSDAVGTCLYDEGRGDWSHPLLEAIGVPLVKMPPIHKSTEVIGTVTDEAARVTGLAAGTPVVVGGGDVTCTLVGADARRPGRNCLYLGTAAWVATPQPETDLGAMIRPTATTGATLKWLLALLESGGSCGELYGSLLREAASAPPGADGLIFLPHLMGERGPRQDPEAKGVFFGLTLAHGRAQMARAVLEGCAFQLRAVIESVDLGGREDLVTVGGGAKSALWLRIMADVTGMTLQTPRVLEAGALGAAIFAAVGVGLYRDVEEAAGALVRIVEQYEPDGVRRAFYDRVYAVFTELEDRVACLYGRVPVV
jgi:xylulokinase